MAGAVPIVSGPPRQDYEKVAPASSFIHVDDFESLEALAARINYLINPKNHNEYMKYHAWRSTAASKLVEVHRTTIREHLETGFCGVCRTAWEQKNKVKIHNFPAVPDLHTWWYGDRRARKKTDDDPVENLAICLPNDRPNLHNLFGRRRKREEATRLVSDQFY